jgi:hypothetical protein
MWVNKINKTGDSYLPCIAMAHSPPSLFRGHNYCQNMILNNYSIRSTNVFPIVRLFFDDKIIVWFWAMVLSSINTEITFVDLTEKLAKLYSDNRYVP